MGLSRALSALRPWLHAARPLRVLGSLARLLAAAVVGLHAALAAVVLAASLLLLAGVNPPFTALMAWRWITVGEVSQPLRWVPLRQIPRAERLMVQRLEDFRFYEHAGVDLGALRDAWEVNAAIGRTAVGGSTIPMQLARNLFLTPRKTYFRKYLEALIALEMDAVLPKDRILELYLNCIEWGKGVFGIGAASRFYYGVAPANLGIDQMRRLATILTSPLRYDVNTFGRSRQMAERYAYLVSRFPAPGAETPAQASPPRIPDAPAGAEEPAAGGAAAAPAQAPDPGGAAANPGP